MAFDSISRAEVARTGNVHRLPFRADIEGLRAIAILLVVGAHAKLPWLAGGYIGVDVFFVLSGYLITGLLLDEFTRTGKIDFITFYARRFQRLLPGLLLMITVTSLAAMALLAPFEQVDQAGAASAAIAWVSNLFFAFSKLDYFGSAAEANLFLHTWSLGVEEQFYLLWPALMLLLLGGWRIAPTRAKDGMWHLATGMAAIGAACFVLSVFLTYAYPEHGFYMVYSRGWQFALGAMAFLAVKNLRDGQPGLNNFSWWLLPVGWLGFAAILACAFLLDGDRPYPGFWALVPSLGTLAILVAAPSGPGQSHHVGYLLSRKPLQDVGRLSYAWYLWHWPMLLLGQALFGNSIATNVALAGASLCVAVVSYRCVESPLRRAPALRAQPRLTLLLGILVIIATLAACREWKQSARLWERDPGQLSIDAIRRDRPIIYRMGCDEWFHSARVKPCIFGARNAPHTAVLLGDSISAQWFPALAPRFSRKGWRFVVITKSACPMVDEPFFYTRIGREYTECSIWRDAAIEFLGTIKPDIVIMSSLSTYPFTSTQWREGTSRILERLSKKSSRIVVIQPTPMLPFDAPSCLARERWHDRFMHAPSICKVPLSAARHEDIQDAIEEAVSGYPSVDVVDMNESICARGECLVERNGMTIYLDEKHITVTYMRTLATKLGLALRSGEGPKVTQNVTSPHPI